jgi:hypothetical protein
VTPASEWDTGPQPAPEVMRVLELAREEADPEA